MEVASWTAIAMAYAIKTNHRLLRQHGVQYDATATDAGYCDYAQSNYDCDGACLNDTDADGICDEFEVAGCTTFSACNFGHLLQKTMAVVSSLILVTVATGMFD